MIQNQHFKTDLNYFLEISMALSFYIECVYFTKDPVVDLCEICMRSIVVSQWESPAVLHCIVSLMLLPEQHQRSCEIEMRPDDPRGRREYWPAAGLDTRWHSAETQLGSEATVLCVGPLIPWNTAREACPALSQASTGAELESESPRPLPVW